MDITPFLQNHLNTVVESWNRWMAPEFALDARLLEQVTFQHPSWRWNRSILAWQGEELVGLLIARDHEQYIIVDALLVHPDRRRQGLGSRLLNNLEKRALRIGGGPSHLFPGLPENWEGERAFLLHHEFQALERVEDLHRKLDPRSGPFTQATESDLEAVIDMVRAEFSQRWTQDTMTRFHGGDAGDIILLKDGSEILAFCHTWHSESSQLGPSVFWLRNQCDTFGGIGPVGVIESRRGQGLGREVMESALNYLAHRGAAEVVVDWTTLGDFYQQFGFETWRGYQVYHRPPRRLL